MSNVIPIKQDLQHTIGEIYYGPGFIKTYRRITKPKEITPILFFHAWRDGEIEWQGFIYYLRSDGTGMAQLYDWFMGAESERIVFTKSFLERCSFYTTDWAMRNAHCIYSEQADD
jgi:hypothetical protein